MRLWKMRYEPFACRSFEHCQVDISGVGTNGKDQASGVVDSTPHRSET